jgi:hypothetical protein
MQTSRQTDEPTDEYDFICNLKPNAGLIAAQMQLHAVQLCYVARPACGLSRKLLLFANRRVFADLNDAGRISKYNTTMVARIAVGYLLISFRSTAYDIQRAALLALRYIMHTVVQWPSTNCRPMSSVKRAVTPSVDGTR